MTVKAAVSSDLSWYLSKLRDVTSPEVAIFVFIVPGISLFLL
jgi:hypothetical protein